MTAPTEGGPYQLAGGSVAGRSHAISGRNNQDGFCWIQSERGAVAVVCDGCGSRPHSEIGAKVGARLVAESATMLLDSNHSVDEVLERVRTSTLEGIEAWARGISARHYREIVVDYFLFTIVGVLVDQERVTPFSLGDGLLVINGERSELGPFENNEPPYLSYGLLHPSTAPRFNVHPSLDLDATESFLVGTDGALELPQLEPFWEDDRIFRNPDMVRRRLAVHQREHRALGDDTTLIVARSQRPTKERG